MNDISALLAEIRLQFISELPARLDDIETNILTLLEADSYEDVFQQVYRAAHSLKGSAGMHEGLDILGTIAHNFENELTHLDSEKQGNIPVNIKTLLAYIDLLRQALDSISNNNEHFADIERQLSALSNQQSHLKYRVLVIESSKSIIDMARHTLSDYPMHIRTCSNGYDALKLLLLEHFDIVITNNEAPMLNGLALIAALRLSNANPGIQSILLTSTPAQAPCPELEPNYIINKDRDLVKNLSGIISKITADIQQPAEAGLT